MFQECIRRWPRTRLCRGVARASRLAHRSAPCQTTPEGSTSPICRGTGGLRKPNMFSDSRKAQHNSFAHHRADLLFAKPTATNGLRKDAARQQKIQAGIDGGAAFK